VLFLFKCGLASKAGLRHLSWNNSGGSATILGVRSVHVGVLDQLGGPDCISRGPALSHRGPDSLLMPWSISLSLAT
jgi:hypothetical protein